MSDHALDHQMTEAIEEMPRIVAITCGCPNGIGLEITAGALNALATETDNSARLLWLAPPGLVEQTLKQCGIQAEALGDRVEIYWPFDDTTYGHDSNGALEPLEHRLALSIQRDAVLLSIDLALSGTIDGIVTAPCRKEAFQDIDGASYPGHTELYDAHLNDGRGMGLMTFVGGPFVLGLATVHEPLASVPQVLSDARVGGTLFRLIEASRVFHGLELQDMCRIDVLGLNPHAGEGGLLGDEEQRIITPAIERLVEEYPLGMPISVEGPFPADGYFGSKRYLERKPHGVLAMYHDQGLVPYKMLTGKAGVNMTWGLSVQRASPDHGTADDLWAKGKASYLSMRHAIEVVL